jgi:D-xylose reductase
MTNLIAIFLMSGPSLSNSINSLSSVLQEPVVRAAAQRHGRTPAQVVLRWAVQRGTAIVSKTVRTDRLVENLTLFDFKLSTEEMGAVSSLNCDRRFNDPGVFCETAFHTFCPVYE